MKETRFKDRDWTLNHPERLDRISTWQHVQIAVLMDIRDELKELNKLLHCQNFQHIPSKLERIAKNTKPKEKA